MFRLMQIFTLDEDMRHDLPLKLDQTALTGATVSQVADQKSTKASAVLCVLLTYTTQCSGS